MPDDRHAFDVGTELTRLVQGGAWAAVCPKLFVEEKSVVLTVRTGSAHAGITFNQNELTRAKTDRSFFDAKMRAFAEDVRALEWSSVRRERA